MTKGLSKNTQKLIKISQAAKILGVSVDTLRRWEASGKINVIRTPAGTRLYSVESLKVFNKSTAPIYKDPEVTRLVSQIHEIKNEALLLSEQSLAQKSSFFPITALTLGAILLLTSLVTASYLTYPNQTKNFFSKKEPPVARVNEKVLGIQSDNSNLFQTISSTALSPFNFLAKRTIQLVDSQKAEDLGIVFPTSQVVINTDVEKRLSTLEIGLIDLSDLSDLLASKLDGPAELISGSEIPNQIRNDISGSFNDNPTFNRVIAKDGFIGKTIIDSFGSIYDQADADSLKRSLGVWDRRFYGLYLNRFDVDRDGNLKVFGKTILGDGAADTVKIIGRLANDLIPATNNEISLGNGDYYFKEGNITTIRGSTANFTTVNATNITSSSLSCTDCLDFDDLEDTLDLDASTEVNLGVNNLTVDLDSTGDFIITDAGTAFVTFADDGSTTLANNITVAGTTGITLSGVGADLTFSSSGTHSISASSGTLELGAVTTSGAITLGSGLDIVATATSGTDIGTSSTRLDTIWATTVDATNIAGTLTGGNTNAATFTINADNATADTEDANLAFERGSLTPNAFLTWDSTSDEFDFNSGLNITGTIASTTGLTLTTFTTDITTGTNEALTLAPNGTGDFVFSTDSDTTATFSGSAEGTANVILTAGDLTLSDGDLTLLGGEISATADDVTGTSFSFTGVNTTGTTLGVTANSLSSGSGLDISSTSTAAASNTQKGLNISLSGANSTSTQTTYGGYISNTHTGTSSTNIGLYATASGGTNNYAAIFDLGQVGIGTTSPTYRLDVNGTTGTVAIRAASSTASDILFYGTGTVTGDLNLFNSAISATGKVLGRILNSNSSSSSADAQLDVNVNGASAGDPTVIYSVSGVQNWISGIDNSDSDKFKISGSGALGTNDYLTIDTSGNVGINDTTPNALLDLDSSATTTNVFGITNTGIFTGTGTSSVVQITANSATTGDLLTISGTSLTSGSGIVLTGPSGATAGVTDAALKITSDIGAINNTNGLLNLTGTIDTTGASDIATNLFVSTTNSPTTNVNNAYGVLSTLSDSTALANTLNGTRTTLTLSGNAAKTGLAYYGDVTSSSTTADTVYGAQLVTTQSGAISSGTKSGTGILLQPASTGNSSAGTISIIGADIRPSATGPSTSTTATTNVYGVKVENTGTHAADAGTINQYGLYVTNGTSSTNGTSTKYGLVMEALSGADSNVGAAFFNTSVDNTNYERGEIGWISNVFTIGERSGGTGNSRSVRLGTFSSSGSVFLSPNDVDVATFSRAGGITFDLTTANNRDFNVRSGALFVQGSTGNVGIGTTTPTGGTLHVVGQCVAAGTRIRRRRTLRRRSGQGKDEDEWIEEEIPVEDIKPGDEILSLNDKTGNFEWKRVEKTMDMGIQEVFELLTATGKSIKTTANHPYLSVSEERLLELTNKLRGNKQKQEANNNQNKNNTSFEIEINDFFILHNINYTTALNQYATTNANIPSNRFTILGNNLNFGFLTTRGTIITAPNQPADKFISKSENVNQNFGSIIPSILAFEKKVGKWTKVSQLKVGEFITTLGDDNQPQFERIIAINKVGRVKTYDLQIESTHNFLANNIVAHNTYINSSSATLNAENIDANSLTTGIALDVSSTATALSSGGLLSLSKTGASGSTSFTGDIANITYSQTFNATGTSNTGNVLDISRSITIDDGTAGAISGTVSGAVATISDNCTAGTADTCTHSGGLLSLTQSFASSTGTVLALSNAGTGMTISITDDDLIGLGTSAGRIEFDDQATDEINILSANVGIGTQTPQATVDIATSGRNLKVTSSNSTSIQAASIQGTAYGLTVGTESTSTSFYALNVVTGLTAGSDFSGGTSALYVRADGKIGIGDTGPDAILDIASTLEQLRLAYENTDTNYTSFTVSSAGLLTLAANGSASGFSMSNTQPASVGTTPGTAATSILALSPATGGNTTITTTGTGGIGSGISWTLGTGGTAASANTASTGGAGGAYGVTGGTGGAAAATGTNVGGAGGALSLTGGTGGAASLGSSNTGGAGGAISITAGAAGSGGNANGGTLTLNSGAVTGTGTSTLNLGTSNTTNFEIGDSTVTKTIDIGGVTSSDASTINIATNSTAADTLAIGNSNASTTLALTGGDDWSITTAGAATFGSTLAVTGITTLTGNLNANGGLDVDDVFVVADGGAVTANTDVDLVLASGENFVISHTTPTVDAIAASLGTSSTDGVDALQLTFGVSAASGNIIDITPSYADATAGATSETYNIIDIDAFTATQNATGDTGLIRGLNIGNLTQTETAGTITATALNIGTGWDRQIVFNESSFATCTALETSSGVLTCGTDDTGAASPFTSTGGIIDKTTASDRLRLLYGDAADVQFTIENTTNAVVPTADVSQLLLTGGTTGIITADVDAMYINWEAGNIVADGTISGIHLDLDTITGGGAGDIFYAINVDAITGTGATETAFKIGSGWDIDIDATGTIQTAGQLKSTVATGTAPLAVSSTTKVANLNADLLDGMDSAAFGDATLAKQNTIIDYIAGDNTNSAGNPERPAPSTNLAGAAGVAGNPNGAYLYRYTFVSPAGESDPSPASSTITVTNQQVSLTSIDTGGTQITARRVYRTIASGTIYMFLTEITDNSTTTYTDNTADANLGRAMPHSLFSRLARIDDSDIGEVDDAASASTTTSSIFGRLRFITDAIGTNADTGANNTLFGRFGLNTAAAACTSASCSNETVFSILRSVNQNNKFSQFSGDGNESNPAGTGATIAPGLHQYAGSYTLSSGTLEPNSGKGIPASLYLFFKGSLTISSGATISVAGYGAHGGNGGQDTGNTAPEAGEGGGPNGGNGGTGDSAAAGKKDNSATIPYAKDNDSGSVAGGGGGGGGCMTAAAGGAASSQSDLLKHKIFLHKTTFWNSYGAGGGGGGIRDGGAPAQNGHGGGGAGANGGTGGDGGGATQNVGAIGMNGGHGGGFLYIEAESINNAGTIDARGENSAGGANTDFAGGGGGGGGIIYLRTHTYTNTGTVSSNSGTGGTAGSANCGNGAAGANGFTFVEIVP